MLSPNSDVNHSPLSSSLTVSPPQGITSVRVRSPHNQTTHCNDQDGPHHPASLTSTPQRMFTDDRSSPSSYPPTSILHDSFIPNWFSHQHVRRVTMNLTHGLTNLPPLDPYRGKGVLLTKGYIRRLSVFIQPPQWRHSFPNSLGKPPFDPRTEGRRYFDPKVS